MLGRTQLGVRVDLGRRLECAGTALIRTLNIRTLRTDLGSNALGIEDIWQLGQHMLIKMDGLLVDHLVRMPQSSFFSTDVQKAPR